MPNVLIPADIEPDKIIKTAACIVKINKFS